MYNLGDFEHVHVDELVTPREGQVVYLNRWWVVVNDHVLFYNRGSAYAPQCNPDKTVAEYMVKKYPNASVYQIPVAFVPAKAIYEI
jgi:hypothetical protein